MNYELKDYQAAMESSGDSGLALYCYCSLLLSLKY